MKKVLFRADASSKKGAGHLFRSLALAQALKTEGALVEFVTFCVWPHLIDYIKKQGISVHPVPVTESELGSQNDLEFMLKKIESGYDWVVLDNYHFDTQYQKEIKKTGVRLLMIDDIADRKFCSDLLLNHGAQAKKDDYDAEGKLLLGPQYALIRQEVLNGKSKKKWNDKPQNILLILGGATHKGIFEKILSAVKEAGIKDIRVKVLAGFSNDLDISGFENCEIVNPTLDPSDVYAWADIAVTAGGGTVLELCYYGIPGLIGVVAENQLGVVESISKAGIFKSIGWFKESSIQDISKSLKELLSNPQLFVSMREKALKLVDGNGPKRIVQSIQEVEREYTSSCK